MKLKINIINDVKRDIYPELPFVIVGNDGEPRMLMMENEKIKCLNLILGILDSHTYESINEYFERYPNEKIVESEITIKGYI